jgi:hypothetical protein
MADGLAPGRLDWRGPAQHRKRGLAAQPARIVASGDQQGPGNLGAHPTTRQQRRGDLGRELGEFGVEPVDLGTLGLMAAGELPQGELGRRDRTGQLRRAEGGGDLDQPVGCQAAELAAEFVGCGDDQAARAGLRPGSALSPPSGAPPATPAPSPPCRWRPWGRDVLACERGAGRCFGVDRVGLATPPTLLPVGPVDLHDLVAAANKPAGQARGVAAGPLDPEALHRAQAAGPALELRIAPHARWRRGGPNNPADLIHSGGHMDVFVAVDPDRDQALSIWHARHVIPFRGMQLAGMARTSQTADSTAMRPCARLLSGHAVGRWCQDARPRRSTDPMPGSKASGFKGQTGEAGASTIILAVDSA